MIYAILMAGGMGTRLKVPEEKPLFKLHDKPLIKYVIDNLKSSELIDEIVIAVSPNTRKTTEYLESLNDDWTLPERITLRTSHIFWITLKKNPKKTYCFSLMPIYHSFQQKL